jgi:hypothetical protein
VTPGGAADQRSAGKARALAQEGYSSPGSATNFATGQIDEFQIALGTVRHKAWKESTGWASQPDLGTPPGGASLKPAASWTQNGSRLDVFVVSDGDGALYQNSWDGTNWSGWINQGGILYTAASAQWTANGTRLDVFSVGADGRVYQKFWRSASGWSGWIGLDKPAGDVLSAPSITWTTGGDRLDVFVTSYPSGHIFQKSYLGGQINWTGWGDLGGVLWSTPSAQWVPDGTRIDIFAVGTDGVLYQKTWKNTTGWTGFGGFAGPPAGIGTSPSISWGANAARLDVFVGGDSDSNVYLKTWKNLAGWSGWNAI